MHTLSTTRTDLGTFLYSSVATELDPQQRLLQTSWYFQHSVILRERLAREYLTYTNDDAAMAGKSVMQFFKVYEPCIFVSDIKDTTIPDIQRFMYPNTYRKNPSDPNTYRKNPSGGIKFCPFPSWAFEDFSSHDAMDAVRVSDADLLEVDPRTAFDRTPSPSPLKRQPYEHDDMPDIDIDFPSHLRDEVLTDDQSP